MSSAPRIEIYDYAYERTDEQLLYYSALPAIDKLRWLDEARRFTLLARKAGVIESRTDAARRVEDG